jgi:hypothetical protein
MTLSVIAMLISTLPAADFEVSITPPTKDFDEVLVQSKVGEKTGCLAMTAEGVICFVEGEAKENRRLADRGLSTTWHLGSAMYVNKRHLSVGEGGKILGSTDYGKPFKQLYLYTRPPPTKYVKIVIRDTDKRIDYTLKIVEESRELRVDDAAVVLVHDVFVIEGLDGAAFTFSGSSK